MLDKERISIIIEEINKYFKEIEDMHINSLKDLDVVKFRAASMNIFSIINKTIDLAEEIAIKSNLGFPSEYKELFTLIRRQKIITEQEEEKLKNLVILRNKISHRYGVINEKDVFNALKELEIVKKFIEKIKKL